MAYANSCSISELALTFSNAALSEIVLDWDYEESLKIHLEQRHIDLDSGRSYGIGA